MSKNCNSSYVTMKSDLVKELCEKTLDWIKEYRENVVDEYIDLKIEKSEKSLWRRLFRCSVITREDVLNESMFGRRGGNIVYWTSYDYGETERTAYNLLRASVLVDSINVSVSDLDQINRVK